MKDDYVGVLLEDIKDKLQGLAEAVSDVRADTRELKETVAVIPEMSGDIKAIKAAVTDQSRQLADHETRLSTLEVS